MTKLNYMNHAQRFRDIFLRQVISKLSLSVISASLTITPALAQSSVGRPIIGQPNHPPYIERLPIPPGIPGDSFKSIQKTIKKAEDRTWELFDRARTFEELVKESRQGEASIELNVILSSDLRRIDNPIPVNMALGAGLCYLGNVYVNHTKSIVDDLKQFAAQIADRQYGLKVLSQIFEAEKKSFSTTDTRVALTLLNIGHIYYSMKDYPQALEYYKQSWTILNLYFPEKSTLQYMPDKFFKCLEVTGDTQEAARLKALRDNRLNNFTGSTQTTDITSLRLSPEDSLTHSIKLYQAYSKERPYGGEASKLLERIVNLSYQLKKYEIVCTYTPLFFEMLERRNTFNEREVRKYREKLIDACLSLGKNEDAKGYLKELESQIDAQSNLQDLIYLANMEIKVKSPDAAEKYLDQAEAEILDNTTARPYMRQIESAWTLMGRTDRVEKIQKRIADIKPLR